MNMVKFGAAAALGLLVASCGSSSAPEQAIEESEFVFPDTLNVLGDGYPNAGDPCRRIGESAEVSDYLDHTAQLIGCPSAADAEPLGGTVVGEVDGVTLVSVPVEPIAESEDALVEGTPYHATTIIDCGGEEDCPAGVIRNWGEDGTTLVEVTKADGRKRAIFFNGNTPYGADSAQADGSAGWDFDVSREEDNSVIDFGPEHYVIPDALVLGG